MIKVVNKKDHIPHHSDVYIGRGSGLGNPYTHLPLAGTKAEFQVGSREEAIEMYRNNFGRILRSQENAVGLFQDILMRHLLGFETNLVCYCSPAECHGDVIKEFIEESVKAIHTIIPMNLGDVDYKRLKTPGLYVFDSKFSKYDVMSLEEFKKSVDEGCIIDYDGSIADVLIDGKKSNVYVEDWGGYYGKTPKPLNLWLFDLDDLPGKIEINWANR